MRIILNDPYSCPTYTDTELSGLTYENYEGEVEVIKIDHDNIHLANGKFLNLFPSEYEVIK